MNRAVIHTEDETNLLHTLMYSSKEFSFLAEKRIEKSLQESNIPLSLSQVVVLLSIDSKKEDIAHLSQCKIADFLHVTEATISRHIKSLITQGFLQKNERVDTKRSKDIALTKDGEVQLKKSLEVIHKNITHLLSPLTINEKTELKRLFQKLITPLVI